MPASWRDVVSRRLVSSPAVPLMRVWNVLVAVSSEPVAEVSVVCMWPKRRSAAPSMRVSIVEVAVPSMSCRLADAVEMRASRVPVEPPTMVSKERVAVSSAPVTCDTVVFIWP